MREPSSWLNKGARPPVSRSRWFMRYRGLIIGGVIDAGLLAVLFVLARKFLFAGAATVVVTTSIAPSPTSLVNVSPTAPNQQIDAYIRHLSLTQQIGQLLMLSVYTNAYSSALAAPLRDTQVGGIVFFP